jgi:regulator of protease activity HflC (stomatin/prohibitin superfamily)
MPPTTNCCCFICVRQRNAAVVERCGAFSAVYGAGCHVLIPFVQTVASSVNLRLKQLEVACETKTRDNVFVTVVISVQFQVIELQVKDAHYKLTDHRSQIKAYVEDVIRGAIPQKTLDEAFSSKDDLAHAVKDQLQEKMTEFGYDIVKALVTDLSPDRGVKASMNEINAQKRLKEAATARADGEKILLVKAAEADKEAKYLSGLGVAQQRSAIVNGLKGSISDFAGGVEGTTPTDVMDLLLLTQYFDTIKDIGNNPGKKTLFLNHGPSAVTELQDTLRNGGLMSGAVSETMKR